MKKRIHEESYEENFIKKLLAKEDFKKEREIISGFFKDPIWWLIKGAARGSLKPADIVFISCKKCNKGGSHKRRCQREISRVLKKARRTRKTQRFNCAGVLSGFVMPLIQGDKVYGYIGLCELDAEIPGRPLALFENFMNLLVQDIQRELELSKLYETIRPRAIALSTVHTIHRLISSTLDMDELLPRIARLCIQVMQAYRCSVKLLDPDRNILVPVTTIDIRSKRKLNPKELKVGRGVPGKAVKEGKVLKGLDFLSVPLIDEEVMGVITVYDKVNHKSFTQFDQEILMTIAEQAVIAIKNAQLYREQENLAISSVKSLATILDARGPTAFIPRTAFVNIVLATGKEIGMDEIALRSLHYAALLHDAGQVFVPNEILSKPTKLTGEEYQLIKEHPAQGAKILEPTKYLRPVVPIILHHHENFDGSGYPNGLKGDEIPLGARIMAIVSAFLAMITPRSYRVTRTVEEAKEEIKRNNGTQFDPKVVEVFLKVLDKKEVQDLIEGEYAHGTVQTAQDPNIF